MSTCEPDPMASMHAQQARNPPLDPVNYENRLKELQALLRAGLSNENKPGTHRIVLHLDGIQLMAFLSAGLGKP